MSKQKKVEFSEDTKSKIDELFESVDDIIRRKLSLKLHGETLTFEKLQQTMIDRFPLISLKKCSPRIDLASISCQDVKSIVNGLEEFIPRTSDPCLVQYVQVREFEEVKFFDAELRNGKLFPPRLIIKVGTIESNSSVRVNTGYVLKMPSWADLLNVKDGEIRKIGYQKQKNFVIIPHITCDTEDIIPTIYVRDPDDTGLFTINFTTLSGFVGTLRVVLKAYRVISPRNQVDIIEPEQTNTAVFKSKDQNNGRSVINPKPKVVFESMAYENERGRVVFKTYDATQETIRVFEKQSLVVENLTTLITSRKREWANEKLNTLSGMFVPHCRRNAAGDICKTFTPKVAKGSVYNANTHCFTFIDCRLVVLSERVYDRSDVKVINGAFCDIPFYKDASKSVRKIIKSLNGLSIGVAQCRKIANSNANLPLNRLYRLMDYHRCVIEKDDRLREKCLKTDREMYESRPTDAQAYSVNLYRALNKMINIFYFDGNNASIVKHISANLEELADPQSHTKRKVDEDSLDENVDHSKMKNLRRELQSTTDLI